MTDKEYFDKAAKIILKECRSEKDYMKIYEKIHKYLNEHDVERVDMKYYFESGASERLAMATQRYRREKRI